MKKLITAVLMAASAAISFGQSNQAFIQKQYYASDYGTWQIQGQAPNTYQWMPASQCQFPQPGGGSAFNAFNTNAPVLVQDATPANSEVLTPSFVLINEAICQIAISPIHNHYSFAVMSGTAGLQEALNVIPANIPYAVQVILDRNWYTAVNSIPTQTASGVIGSVKGSAAAILVDQTTAPMTFYLWSGSHYVATSTGSAVTGVTATVPIHSSGGTTPNLSLLALSGAQVIALFSSATGCGTAANILFPGAGTCSSALPNGTTATTQATSDGSTKVATDAFVLANAGGGASAPATNNVYRGNGTLNGIVPATPGTDYLNNSAIPSATGLLKASGTAGLAATATVGADYFPPLNGPGGGQAVISTSTGGFTNYSTTTVPLSYASSSDQFIEQIFDNSLFSTFRVNVFNNRIFADGYNGYAGIGVAPIAWNNSTPNQPMCQVVTYLGSAYMAVHPTNTGVTPGSALWIWAPIPNAIAGTNVDCAWYSGQAYKHQVHQNVTTYLGSGTYHTGGLVDFVDGNSGDDQEAESLEGSGAQDSLLLYTGTAATPVINRPTGGANFAGMQVRNVKIDGGAAASAAIEVGTLGQSYFENISAGDIAPGSDHVLEFGHSGGDAFQNFISNVNIGIFPDNGVVNCATIVANVVGGSITSYTVSNGGTCYSTYSGSTELTVVQVTGYKGGGSPTPCTVMPTGQVATISGGVLTAISEGSNTGGSGCSGTIDVQVYQTPNVAYGARFYNSDSTVKDVTSYIGSVASFYTPGGSDTFIHLHPSVVPNGIVSALGNGHFTGTECDAVSNYCFEFLTPFSTLGTSVVGTNSFIGGGRLLPGSATYYFATSTVANNPVAIANSTSLCGAAPGNVPPTDWNEFVTQTGPIINPADYLTKTPAGLSVLGNDTSCGEVMGDFTPTLSAGTLNVGTISPTSITTTGTTLMKPATPAISGTNQSSPVLNLRSFYFNSSSLNSDITLQNQIGTGSNPVNLLNYTCTTASTGGCQWGFTNFASIIFGNAAVTTNGNAQWNGNSFFGNANQTEISTSGAYTGPLFTLTNPGVFSNSASNFPNETIINGCDPAAIFSAVQFQFLTAGLTSCATAPTNIPGTSYNQTAGGYFVATSSGLGSGSGQAIAVGASDYAILSGGNSAQAYGDNPLVQDVNDGATGQQLIGQEIDTQPQKAASAYANSGFNVIGSSIHLYNQPGQGGIYGPAIFIDTHNFGTPPYWGYGLDTAIAALCPNNCPVLNINAVGQATVGTNFNTPAIFNAYEMYGAGVSEGWMLQGVLNSSTAAAPTADFLQLGHGIGTAPGGQTHTFELMSGINLQLDGSSSGSALLSVGATGGKLNLGSTNATVDNSGNVVAASTKLATYLVSTLPSASTLGAGAMVVVTDATTFAVGTCIGSGSDTMIAVSNGTSWSCH